MNEMEEIVKEFLVESYEGLDQLDQDLVALEENPSDSELLGRIFRCIHTIKGTCGFLGFGQLESVAHVGESLLSNLREGKVELTPEITTALLSMVDSVREMLQSIEKSGKEGDRDDGGLIAELDRLLETDSAPAEAEVGERADPAPVPEPVVDESPPVAVPVAETVPAGVSEQNGTPRQPGGSSTALSENNIRVDVALLDKLMNLVGELVLSRNQVLQYTKKVVPWGWWWLSLLPRVMWLSWPAGLSGRMSASMTERSTPSVSC